MALLNEMEKCVKGMKILLNNHEVTDYERGVMESMLQQWTRRCHLSDKQISFYKKIAANYTENALMAKKAWEESFSEKNKEDLRIIAGYYKAQGTYFMALAEKVLSDKNYIPNSAQYKKMCENKYAEKVLNEHYREPKYEVGKIVYVCSAAPHSYKSRFARGGIILQANAGPITAACKGAKKYLVLPIGEAHGHVLEERWLKSRKPRGLDTKLDDEVPF